MPVLVNYKRCNCMPTCFAAKACPKAALSVDTTQMKVVVQPTVCGDCPAPCLNFCDAVALKFAPNLEELDIMQRELDGVLTAEAALEERRALAEKRQAEDAAARADEEEAAEVVVPVTLTMENFMQEVVQSELPVLVDFWAEWCGPCKQIGPVVEQLAQEYAGIIKFAKLNTDDEPQIAAQLGIQSIPTLMVFFQGQLVDRIVGAVSKEQLRSRLQRIAEEIARVQGLPAPKPAAPKAAAKPAAKLPGPAKAAPKPEAGTGSGSAQPPTPRPTLIRPGGTFRPRK